MKIIYLVIASALLAGCGFEAEVAEESKNKIIKCVDTRDGESFEFNTNDIKNLKIGVGAPHSFEVKSLDGIDRKLDDSMKSFLKCKEKEHA